MPQTAPEFPPGPEAPSNPIETVRYFRDVSRDPIAFVGRRFDEYGDIYYAPVRGQDLFVIRHPDHIEDVLLRKAKHFEKTTTGFAAERLHRLLGDGLVNANGDHWRRHRRMINPALSRRRIRDYASTIVDYTTEMVDGWLTGQRLDIARVMTELTLRIVTRVLFDTDGARHADTVHEAMIAFRESTGVGSMLPSWVPYSPNRRFEEALEAVDRIIYDMIDERQRIDPADLADRSDLLSQLVQVVDDAGDGEGLTRRELRDELLTLFFAGHETTSNALTWSWWLLSQNPDVQEWWREELRALEGELTAARLGDLPRTRAVFQESMRLLPPVCAISRTATADVEVGKWTIPRGAEVLIWFFWTHHDKRWFENPETFRPRRFIGETDWPRNAYIPFGAGQRTCIGKHFALMEGILILAEIGRQRRLEFAGQEPPTPDMSVTLSPRDGLPMRVQRAKP